MTSLLASSSSGSELDLARVVLIHGPIMRKELGDRLGLSAASLTRLARPLIDAGLLLESAERPPGAAPGRPRIALDVRLDARTYVGVKVTASEAVAVRTDLRANVLEVARRPVRSHDVEEVQRVVHDAVEAVSAGTPSAVGVTLGGRVRRGQVLEAPFLGWRDVDLARDLSARLDVVTVVENDVTALTAAQHWFGVAKGVSSFATVTVGAGVGYGLVIQDTVVLGGDSGVGCHLPLDPRGPRCPEGHPGCAEAMLSTAGLVAAAYGEGSSANADRFRADLEAELAPAVLVMETSAGLLGRLLAIIADSAMVELIVISGEGAGLYQDRFELVDQAFRLARPTGAHAVELAFSDLEFDSWAQAAAALAIQSSFRSAPGPV